MVSSANNGCAIDCESPGTACGCRDDEQRYDAVSELVMRRSMVQLVMRRSMVQLVMRRSMVQSVS